MIGVHPSEEYTFAVFVMPVGPYDKNGIQPVAAYVQERGRVSTCPVSSTMPTTGMCSAASHFDPTETGVVRDFCGAKPSFVCPQKRDIVPSVAWVWVAWQPTSDGEN